jgi:acyl homoserine lactone synthase
LSVHLISGAADELPDGLVARIGRYRHQVFIERLGWPLESEHGLEHDRFDGARTVYVAVENESGEIAGCARLLPTTQSYLLSEIFPQLLEGMAPPRDARIWELSRFASMDFSRPATTPLAQFSSSATALLMRGALECAARLGAERLITVSPLGIERLIRRLGICAERAGAPKMIGGQAMFACWIAVQPTPTL